MNAIKVFTKYMSQIGAKVPNLNYPLEFIVETIYGDLRVSIHKSDYTTIGKPRSKHNNFVSIYTSFVDFERAKEYLGTMKGQRIVLNTKHNYHSSGGEDVETVWNYNFEHFKYDLEQILVKKEELVII